MAAALLNTLGPWFDHTLLLSLLVFFTFTNFSLSADIPYSLSDFVGPLPPTDATASVQIELQCSHIYDESASCDSPSALPKITSLSILRNFLQEKESTTISPTIEFLSKPYRDVVVPASTLALRSSNSTAVCFCDGVSALSEPLIIERSVWLVGSNMWERRSGNISFNHDIDGNGMARTMARTTEITTVFRPSPTFPPAVNGLLIYSSLTAGPLLLGIELRGDSQTTLRGISFAGGLGSGTSSDEIASFCALIATRVSSFRTVYSAADGYLPSAGAGAQLFGCRDTLLCLSVFEDNVAQSGGEALSQQRDSSERYLGGGSVGLVVGPLNGTGEKEVEGRAFVYSSNFSQSRAGGIGGCLGILFRSPNAGSSNRTLIDVRRNSFDGCASFGFGGGAVVAFGGVNSGGHDSSVFYGWNRAVNCVTFNHYHGGGAFALVHDGEGAGDDGHLYTFFRNYIENGTARYLGGGGGISVTFQNGALGRGAIGHLARVYTVENELLNCEADENGGGSQLWYSDPRSGRLLDLRHHRNFHWNCTGGADGGGGASFFFSAENSAENSVLYFEQNTFIACRTVAAVESTLTAASIGGGALAIVFLDGALHSSSSVQALGSNILIQSNNFFYCRAQKGAGGAISLFYESENIGTDIHAMINNTYINCGAGATQDELYPTIEEIAAVVRGRQTYNTIFCPLSSMDYMASSSAYQKGLGGGALAILAVEATSMVPTANTKIFNVTLIGERFEGCYARAYGGQSGGGAVTFYLVPAEISISDSIFFSCCVSGGYGGGAIAFQNPWWFSGKFLVRSSRFEQNRAFYVKSLSGGWGGAVLVMRADLNVTSSTFVHNRADPSQGGAYDIHINGNGTQSSASIVDCQFFEAGNPIAPIMPASGTAMNDKSLAALFLTPFSSIRLPALSPLNPVSEESASAQGTSWMCPAGYQLSYEAKRRATYRSMNLTFNSGTNVATIEPVIEMAHSLRVECSTCVTNSFSPVAITGNRRCISCNGPLFCPGGASVLVHSNMWLNPALQTLALLANGTSSPLFNHPYPLKSFTHNCPLDYCCNVGAVLSNVTSTVETMISGLRGHKACVLRDKSLFETGRQMQFPCPAAENNAVVAELCALCRRYPSCIDGENSPIPCCSCTLLENADAALASVHGELQFSFLGWISSLALEVDSFGNASKQLEAIVRSTRSCPAFVEGVWQSASVCAGNRKGTFCGECNDGFRFSVLSTSCTNSCSDAWMAVAAAVVVVGCVVFDLYFVLSPSSPYRSPFFKILVYFLNALPIVAPSLSFVSAATQLARGGNFQEIISNVATGLANFDFQATSVPLCMPEGASAIGHLLVHLVLPLLLLVVLFLIFLTLTVASKYNSFAARRKAKKSASSMSLLSNVGGVAITEGTQRRSSAGKAFLGQSQSMNDIVQPTDEEVFKQSASQYQRVMHALPVAVYVILYTSYTSTLSSILKLFRCEELIVPSTTGLNGSQPAMMDGSWSIQSRLLYAGEVPCLYDERAPLGLAIAVWFVAIVLFVAPFLLLIWQLHGHWRLLKQASNAILRRMTVDIIGFFENSFLKVCRSRRRRTRLTSNTDIGYHARSISPQSFAASQSTSDGGSAAVIETQGEADTELPLDRNEAAATPRPVADDDDISVLTAEIASRNTLQEDMKKLAHASLDRKIQLLRTATKAELVLATVEFSFANGKGWYESVYLIRRLSLVMLAAFVVDPFARAVSISIFCVFVLVVHAAVRPFTSFVYNMLETLSLFTLTIIATLEIVSATFLQGYVNLDQTVEDRVLRPVQLWQAWLTFAWSLVLVILIVIRVAAVVFKVCVSLYNLCAENVSPGRVDSGAEEERYANGGQRDNDTSFFQAASDLHLMQSAMGAAEMLQKRKDGFKAMSRAIEEFSLRRTGKGEGSGGEYFPRNRPPEARRHRTTLSSTSPFSREGQKRSKTVDGLPYALPLTAFASDESSASRKDRARQPSFATRYGHKNSLLGRRKAALASPLLGEKGE